MSRLKQLYSGFLIFIVAVFVTACTGESSQDSNRDHTPQLAAGIALDVYKSPTCGCCGKWIDHAENDGFIVKTHHPHNLDALKTENNIQGRYRSCHTAISHDGYVFEGHIPAKLIRKFLQERPADAIGLAVPGMPTGSPGMEAGDTFRPYSVLILKSNGSSEIYAKVHALEEQY